MKLSPDPRRRSLKQIVGGLLTAAALPLTLLFVASAPAQAADTTVYDGSSPAQAAASCWEIKQVAPSAPSGIFWLRTPALIAPTQFYCDQTTNGGGWVLIGRGREGWKENYQGSGTTAQVSANITGTAAFVPRQLSSTVIDGLLNGQSPDSLADGVRLRRATNTDGTTWQEATYKLTKQPRWVWTLRSETPVGAYKFDASTGTGGQTNNFGSDQNIRRVFMQTAVTQNWLIGFSFGTSARGQNNATSYIWSASATAGNPQPFTQIYLRPKLLQANLNSTAIPDSGTAAYAQRSLAETGSLPTVWGVSGLANGSTSEMATEAQAFTQSGNTVYVGGNFKFVQQNSAGAGQMEQSYLAGFNASTGAWVSTFRPTFNGQLRSLTTLPNGNVVAGGEFTQANGQPAAGIVVLDPVTGTTATDVSITMVNALSGGLVQVRSLKVEGNWLYIGGNFTHVGGGTHPSPTVYSRGAARVSITNGTPDASWNPALNGTVSEVEPSADGTHVYAAGYFTSSNSTPANKIVALQTVAGAPLTSPVWTMVSSSSADFQFTVSEAATTVWNGGSEHDLFNYNKSTLALVSTNIAKANGDFQTSEVSDGVLYAGCHCNDWIYAGATKWPTIGTGWTIADKLGFVGAWDATTGAIISDFNPILDTRAGHGAWGTFTDTTGTLWIGGDFTNSVSRTGASQWSGGFVRFAPRDSSAPPAPSNLQATGNGLTDTLTWQPSSESSVSYQILRNDRVTATVTGATTFNVATVAGARYFVRSVDAAGNYSASTSVAVAPVIATPPQVVVSAGATWMYRFANSAPDPAWNTTAYDDSTWASGGAPLGFGDSSIVTTLTAVGTKPLAAQYRKSFTIADATQIASMALRTRADDGLVVYVNGVEVGRSNMPTGAITFSSYALSAPTTAAAVAKPVTFTVPGSAFVTGNNTITAEVHSNFRATSNTSFDLTALATLGIQPAAAAKAK